MAGLAGEQGYLAPVMGVVCDQIGEKAGHVGFEGFDTAVAGQGFAEGFFETFPTGFEGFDGLLLCRRFGV